jgi:hypothetical protein
MKYSKRSNHRYDIWERGMKRTVKSLNEYCRKIVLDDIEKMSGDDIKERVLELFKESDSVDYVTSICSLSETYSYGQYGLDSDRKIVIDKTKDRNQVNGFDGQSDFTRNVEWINSDLLKNNEELLFEFHKTTEEDYRLMEVLDNMTNTEYLNLYKKHYDKNKKVNEHGKEYVDTDELYYSIESELN